MSKETERCLWMAKQLGLKAEWREEGHCGIVPPRPSGAYYKEAKTSFIKRFALEHHATDREAALIWLGEKHGITLTFQDTGDGGCWGIFKYGVGDIGYEILDGTESHKAALMSAIDFLMEKDNG